MTHPTTPIDIKCPFCFALPGNMCRVAKAQGGELRHYHMQRRHAFDRVIVESRRHGARVDPAPTTTETSPTLEAQVRAALNATLGLAETVTTLNTLLDGYQRRLEALEERQTQFFVRQAIDQVMARIDGDEPSFADVIEHDERKMFIELGLDDRIEYVVEEVVSQ